MQIKLSAPSGSDIIPDYRLLVSVPHRNRGRVNRFAVQAKWNEEKDRIIALKTEGKSVSAIAKIMEISPATVYRRVAATRVPTDGTLLQKGGRREKMTVALLTQLLANARRIQVLAAERKEKRMKAACCTDCASHILANETIRLSIDFHKAEIACLTQLGLFDDVRASGRAMEIMDKVLAQEVLDKAEGDAADSAVTSAVV